MLHNQTVLYEAVQKVFVSLEFAATRPEKGYTVESLQVILPSKSTNKKPSIIGLSFQTCIKIQYVCGKTKSMPKGNRLQTSCALERFFCLGELTT